MAHNRVYSRDLNPNPGKFEPPSQVLEQEADGEGELSSNGDTSSAGEIGNRGKSNSKKIKSVEEKKRIDQEALALYRQRVFKHKHRNVKAKWEMSVNFPDLSVLRAYKSPVADTSKEVFTWGKVDVPGITKFLVERLGWSESDTKRQLAPVLKSYLDKTPQSRLDSFFSEDDQFAHVESARIQAAVYGLTGEALAEQKELERAAVPRPRQVRPTKKKQKIKKNHSDSDDDDASEIDSDGSGDADHASVTAEKSPRQKPKKSVVNHRPPKKRRLRKGGKGGRPETKESSDKGPTA